MDAPSIIRLLIALLPTVPWVLGHGAVVLLTRHPLLTWGMRAASFGYGWLLWRVAHGFMGDRFLSDEAALIKTAWAWAVCLLLVLEIVAALRHRRRAAHSEGGQT